MPLSLHWYHKHSNQHLQRDHLSLFVVLIHSLFTTEHPEILDDRGEREAASSVWERLDVVTLWGKICLPEMRKHFLLFIQRICLGPCPALLFVSTCWSFTGCGSDGMTMEWRLVVSPCCPFQGIPQQTNENDCGVFVLEVTACISSSTCVHKLQCSCLCILWPPSLSLPQYCRCLALEKPLQFSQRDIPSIRKRIYKELCDCKLYE